MVMLYSIIIPVYNTQSYVKSCLESVFNNDTRDFEIIVVNDGSTDDSLRKCQQIQLKYPNYIKIIDQPNLGVSVARNEGIEAATGDYLIFLDSDDKLAPGSLDNANLEKNEDWHIFNYESNDYLADAIKNDSVIEVNNANIIAISEKILYPYRNVAGVNNANYSTPWPKIFKREIIESNKLRYVKNCHMGEDMIFNLQYLQYCKSIRLHCDKWYYQTLDRPDSATNHEKSEQEQLMNELTYNKALKKVWLEYQLNDQGQYLYYDKLITNFVNDYLNYGHSLLDFKDIRQGLSNVSKNSGMHEKSLLASLILEHKRLSKMVLGFIRLFKKLRDSSS